MEEKHLKYEVSLLVKGIVISNIVGKNGEKGR